MTKALRITIIVVAGAAVLLIALPPVFSSGIDAQTQALLDSPGVLETLNKAVVAGDTETASPLVQQAQAFARYLNPPPPPRPTPRADERIAVRPKAVSSKFDLVATSYYALRPDMSLALIDEPGSGLRWVRQSGQIGHLTVEEIKDGAVVIRDDTRTYELQVKREPKRSLIKGESPSGAGVLPWQPSPQARTSAASPLRSPLQIKSHRGKVADSATLRQNHQPTLSLSTQQSALFDEFVKENKDINDPNVLAKRTNELMNRLANMSQVTDKEAQRLDELGEELKDANEEAPSE
jgi:hypothetical protein